MLETNVPAWRDVHSGAKAYCGHLAKPLYPNHYRWLKNKVVLYQDNFMFFLKSHLTLFVFFCGKNDVGSVSAGSLCSLHGLSLTMPFLGV